MVIVGIVAVTPPAPAGQQEDQQKKAEHDNPRDQARNRQRLTV
jgi:hypothetical protein